MVDIYQLQYESEVEQVFVKTNLEECTDITYESNEIDDLFGNVSCFGRITSDTTHAKGWRYGNETKIAYLNLAEVSRLVKQQLLKCKEVNIEISDCFNNDNLTALNASYFKQQGFMYRPSKGHFVAYKHKNIKPVFSKALLNDLRRNTVFAIQNLARDKFGITIELKYCSDKVSQARCVAFGVTIGLTLKQIEEFVREEVTNVLTKKGQESMIELTIQEYKNWLVSSSQLKKD